VQRVLNNPSGATLQEKVEALLEAGLAERGPAWLDTMTMIKRNRWGNRLPEATQPQG